MLPNRGLCDCPPDTRGDACNGTCPQGQRRQGAPKDEKCPVHGYRHYPGNVNAPVITEGCYVPE